MRIKFSLLSFIIIALLVVSFIIIMPGQGEQEESEEHEEQNDTYIPVLMYHKIDDEGTPTTAVITSSQFREHLLALKAAGYETILDSELVDAVKHGTALPEKPILVTFDDGYLNNYTLGFPALQEYDMKATIYTIVSYRGQKPGWNEHFDWDVAKEMTDSGLVSIQSHSYASHHMVPDTSPRRGYLVEKLTDEDGNVETRIEYEDRVKHDIALSKHLIERHTGQPVVSFSYPFGQYTEETEAWLKEAGYEMSVSVKTGVYKLGDPTWAIPRITVNGEWSGEELVSEIERIMQLD